MLRYFSRQFDSASLYFKAEIDVKQIILIQHIFYNASLRIIRVENCKKKTKKIKLTNPYYLTFIGRYGIRFPI